MILVNLRVIAGRTVCGAEETGTDEVQGEKIITQFDQVCVFHSFYIVSPKLWYAIKVFGTEMCSGELLELLGSIGRRKCILILNMLSPGSVSTRTADILNSFCSSLLRRRISPSS